MRIVCIANPASGRRRRGLRQKLTALPAAIPAEIKAEHFFETTRDATSLDEFLAPLALGQGDLLLIAGGDGTLSIALGALLRQCESDLDLPIILPVPTGSTNLTALDLHGRTNARVTLSRLKAILARPMEQWPVQRRPVLRLETETDELDRYGFVFGMGAFAEGVSFFNDKVRGGGLGQEWSAAFAAAKTLFGAGGLARGRSGPVTVDLHLDDAPRKVVQGPARLSMLMASTLERTLFRLHYHWADGDSPIRYLSFGAETPKLKRALIAILFGTRPKWLLESEHYQSGALTRVGLGFTGPFVLDGELFNVDAGKLTMSAERRIPLLKLTDQVPY